MRIAFLLLLLASHLHAAPDWLSTSWGFRLGMGGSSFAGGGRPDPSGAFSTTSPQSTQSRVSVPGGDFGFTTALGWRRRLELQAELVGIIDGSRSLEDLGGGSSREVIFTRNSIEVPVLLKAAWPFDFENGDCLRPFAMLGLWGNRMILAGRRIVAPGQPEDVVEWPGAPNEDWGWSVAGGADFRFRTRFYLGAEMRYREGQTDLDPRGAVGLKARTITLALLLGF